ncbi:organic hydroperoxide resistance protein [Bdellovibrio sp. SKB1291214]|uniref:organic hydroperoxide resistance protein n=1 Tax=Bdellovibrio sp. SKB1291214 TaxID=1732569 RepID=UPI000B51C4E2|nr:organic hydroperoxide resistance protein [Bdellovibrio sp. SKB1291214]UYL09062.1 organic hydroperoxide resistance protein [Bdellovibrio sp. SKB1291214]
MSKLYTAVATANGGRNGKVESSDGVLNLEVRIPKEMGGSGGAFTNPEQLFAAGYAACFDSALNFVAMQQKLKITSAVTAEVGIGPNDKGGFALAVKLRAKIEGIERAIAHQLLDTAHLVCPYSNATRGNIPVTIELV